MDLPPFFFFHPHNFSAYVLKHFVLSLFNIYTSIFSEKSNKMQVDIGLCTCIKDSEQIEKKKLVSEQNAHPQLPSPVLGTTLCLTLICFGIYAKMLMQILSSTNIYCTSWEIAIESILWILLIWEMFNTK